MLIKKLTNKKIALFLFAGFFISIFFYLISKFEKKNKILVVWTGSGEREWAKRLELVCSNLKWECKTVYLPKRLFDMEKNSLPDSSIESPSSVIDEFKPDLIITLSERCQRICSSVKNYFAIAGNSKSIFNITCKDPEELLEYDGFLSASTHIEKIQNYVESHRKSFYSINWYPSCAATNYKPVVPKRLFYCGFQWDDKRNGSEYQKMFSLLDKQGYFEVYGPDDRWDCAPNSRKGFLPFDGKSVCEAIHNCGIALILHAQNHIDLSAPTSRIFEAASACSVIISDKNPFICNEFGQTILYIDGDLNGEALFAQIDGHVKWILSHPTEAEAMAQKAHAIFVKKFTLEKQMMNLITMHKKIASRVKKNI